MRRLTPVLALIGLACGGSDAATGPSSATAPGVVAAIDVEQGARQSARPQRAMPDSVVARATDDAGQPVEGRIVEFQIPAGPEAGSVDQTTLSTNPQGRVFYELTAGDRAWTSRVAAGEDSAYTARLVASVDGRSNEVAELTFSVLPGDPVIGQNRTDHFSASTGNLSGEAPLTVPVGDRFAAVRDARENPVPWDLEILAFAHAEESQDQVPGRRTVAVDSLRQDPGAETCSPFYVRVRATGAKADSGIVVITDVGTERDIEMTLGSNPWDPGNTHHDSCVAPFTD